VADAFSDFARLKRGTVKFLDAWDWGDVRDADTELWRDTLGEDYSKWAIVVRKMKKAAERYGMTASHFLFSAPHEFCLQDVRHHCECG
jgi:hypothetical protein